MPIDTSRTIEIESSPAKTLSLIGGGVVLAVASAAIAFGWLPDVAPSRQAWGYAGLVLFGLGTAIGLWRLFTVRGPVVTIAPDGISDTRIAADFIPWGAITGISTWQLRHQKVMVLAVDPAVERTLALTRMARWTRGANRALGADGLCIAAQNLKIDHATLIATVTAYRAAAAGRTRAA